MKNTLILASFLALAPLAKGQLLLEALDAPEAIVLPTLPNGITISNGQHFIASIYDTDYLPYQVPTSTAVWTTVSADNQPEDKVIDYQGIVPATGISVHIPITATGNATLPAFTSSEIAIDPQGEEGVANSNRKVVLSWAQQNITSSTKFITAVIKPSNNQEIKVKKLDLNGGLGNDYKGTLLANFSLPKSNLNTTEKVGYELRVLSGIPDKNFNNQIAGEYSHQFIYLPIRGADGKIWLNNDLGARTTSVGSASFNPFQQDCGSLFQWQRPADGHELVNRDNNNNIVLTETTSAIVNDPNWVAGHNKFVNNTRDWVDSSISSSSVNKNLWQVGGANNPCPTGFHVPTYMDFEKLASVIEQHTGYMLLEDEKTNLGFSSCRPRNTSGIIPPIGRHINRGLYSAYWTSTYSSEYKAPLALGGIEYYQSLDYWTEDLGFLVSGYGASIRCIQD